MFVPVDTRARVEAKIREGLSRAEKHYGRKFAMPTIDYKLRGRTAGTATGQTNHLSFNAVLLMENLDDFIDDNTVPHELAHLIDYVVNPHNHDSNTQWTGRGYRRTKRNVHGADFKYIMETVLGTSQSERCHSYDTSNSKVSKTMYLYKCTCGCEETALFSGKSHKAVLRGTATYWKREPQHRRSPMVFVRVVRPNDSTNTATPVPVRQPAPALLPRAASQAHPTPDPTSVSTPVSGGSTKDIARHVYATCESRADFISRMEGHGVKKTTASTYYQNFKSGTWK